LYLESYLEARNLAQENSEASSGDNLYEDTRLKKKTPRFVSSKDQTSLPSPPIIESESKLF